MRVFVPAEPPSESDIEEVELDPLEVAVGVNSALWFALDTMMRCALRVTTTVSPAGSERTRTLIAKEFSESASPPSNPEAEETGLDPPTPPPLPRVDRDVSPPPLPPVLPLGLREVTVT